MHDILCINSGTDLILYADMVLSETSNSPIRVFYSRVSNYKG